MEISAFLLAFWREAAQAAAARNESFSVALSGGTTPEFFYRQLAELKEKALWNMTNIFMADERMVPYDNIDSNYGKMKSLFLDQSGIRASNIHEVATGLLPHARAAAAYEAEIRQFFEIPDKHDTPIFDLVLLGIGEDGHTASLFPDAKELANSRRLAVPMKRESEDFGRVSLTLRVINNARNVIFLVTDKRKAEILKRVITGNDSSLPAARVAPHAGRLIFLLDKDAASLGECNDMNKDKYKIINQNITED